MPAVMAIAALVELFGSIADVDDPAVVGAHLADGALRHLDATGVALFTATHQGWDLAHARGVPLKLPSPDAADLERWAQQLAASAGMAESRVLSLDAAGERYGLLWLGWSAPMSCPEPTLALAAGLADTATIGLARAQRTAERMRSLEHLSERKAALVRTDGLRRIGQMAAILAHDVRNPLAGIGGVLHVLRTRFPEGSVEREMSSKALDRLGDLNRLVGGVLQFARPQGATCDLIEVRLLLEEVIAGTDLGGSQHPAIGIAAAPATLIWPIDRAMMVRLLTHLIHNAVQAQEGPGRIDVGARLVDAGRALELWVDDDGPGVPEAHRGTLFEPFVSHRARGTGLGLAICRQIAEAHAGAIVYDTSPLGGARFMVRLGR